MSFFASPVNQCVNESPGYFVELYSKLGMILRFVTKCAILLNAGAYVWSWSPVNM